MDGKVLGMDDADGFADEESSKEFVKSDGAEMNPIFFPIKIDFVASISIS